MHEKIMKQVEGLVISCVSEMSAELVDFQVKRRSNTVAVDVIVDKPGGITIGECAVINKRIDRQIEESQCLGDDYVVEVASPGLDRALKTKRDFQRVVGRVVQFHLLEAVEGKVEHVGEVTSVNGEKVSVRKKDNVIVIPLEFISKAVQVI